jgi:predicted RNA binding protein YcfA (HicA-like mRNA interferase family)
VKLPRDLSGAELARALSRYGYQITRQSGSHLRLTSSYKGTQHHVTIPAHTPLKIGTLSQILADVAGYLEFTRDQLAKELFV